MWQATCSARKKNRNKCLSFDTMERPIMWWSEKAAAHLPTKLWNYENMKLWNYTPWTGISLQLTLTHACGIEKTMWKLSAAYFYHTSVVYGGVLYQLILVAQNSLLKTCFDFCFEKEKPWINGFYYQVSLLTNSLMYKNSCVRNISIWLQWLQKLNIWVIKGVLLQLQVLLQSVNENLL